MDAAVVLHLLHAAGLQAAVADDRLLVTPAKKLTDELRAAIREHRDELVRLVLDPDTRVRCLDCAHHRPLTYRCSNHVAAGLQHPDIAPDLATLLQHCLGHLGRAAS